MSETRKKCWKDRRDGYYLKNLDSMHIIMPFVMPHRCANEAVVGEEIDISAVVDYVQKRNAQEQPDFKYTWFHVICAALAKTLILRPKMNYFISGYRLYERKDIELAFTIKRKFEENSEEALAKVVIDKENSNPMDQVYSKVKDYVTKVRVHDKTMGITNQFNFYQVLPRFIFRIFVWLLKVMEYFGIYPQSMAKDDPCYCSVYVTNLGSIKLSADYHHLFEWGNNSFFVVIGEKKMSPIFKEDGSYEMKPTVKISFTIDERIADGYYYSKSIRLFKYLMAHPELLELDAKTPVEFE